jgi:aryl-alcohol dehydrogenase-like predicted oxidoreductase
MYGSGESEELVGRALRRHPDKTVYVGTKVGHLGCGIVAHLAEAAYQDEDALRRAINHSLWLLQRDRIDMLMIHEPNFYDGWWGRGLLKGDAPVLKVMNEMKAEGTIGAIGLGCWDAPTTVELIETGCFDVALVACRYTVIEDSMHEGIIPAAKKHDTGVIVGGAFLQGTLATIQRERFEDIRRAGKYDEFDEKTVGKILAIYDLCDQAGLNIVEMAIRYILEDQDIHSLVTGAQKVSEMADNLAYAARGPLPVEVVKRIKEISAS